MTSEQTREKTEQFFAAHNYFGLEPKNVVFFEQSTIPCVDGDGKIILETRSTIARAPGLY
jgi:UDP-N-acetylglucosamine/UDP-N-acetylgalactosamine diphosphorylase